MSRFEEYRSAIVVCLLDARSKDPWTTERIAAHTGIQLKTKAEVKAMTRFIRGLIKHADPNDSLHYVGNEGRGYYFPEFEDEAERLKIRNIKISKGFFNSAQKYEAHKAKAKKRDTQMTIDDFEVNSSESRDTSA